jgi:hypothetical protein
MKLLGVMVISASALGVNAQIQTDPSPGNQSPPPSEGPAVPPEGPGIKRHHAHAFPLMVVLDANDDGIIDATEITNAPVALRTLDRNGDGKLTEDEWSHLWHHKGLLLAAADSSRPNLKEGPDGDLEETDPNGLPLPPSPLMAVLDVNHDGVIDADEIANAAASLMKLDKNGDGKLTPDELRPQRTPLNSGIESTTSKSPGLPPAAQ